MKDPKNKFEPSFLFEFQSWLNLLIMKIPYFRFGGLPCIITLIATLLTSLISLNPSANLHAQKRTSAKRSEPALSLSKGHSSKFERISLEQGLSQSSVFCILQDSKGFMWFGTQDGLNKYDGYSFTVYKNQLNDSTSLNWNYIRCFYEDRREGVLWVGTDNGGLNKFDLMTETFKHYTHSPDVHNSLSSQ